MAKTTKKTAIKATEVKTLAQLQTELATKQNDLVQAKRSHKAGELVNPRVITVTRKEIARLHTAITVAQATQNKENK
ncbi:50S ribosomal protein L29 [Candidatus Saccharibacteria bacterium]|nr:50S ribosomal protein L29 [Candidatus Saccharibacteria bacterium]